MIDPALRDINRLFVQLFKDPTRLRNVKKQ